MTLKHGDIHSNNASQHLNAVLQHICRSSTLYRHRQERDSLNQQYYFQTLCTVKVTALHPEWSQHSLLMLIY